MTNAKSLDQPIASESTQKSRTDPTRRRFLFALGLSSAGAAAVTAGALPAAAAQDAAPTNQDAAYRESEHVRDYYRTTRI